MTVVQPGATVLVTGAAGGIGRAVVETLTAAGLRVVGADRVPAEPVDGLEVRVGDVLDRDFVLDCLRPGPGPAVVDAVVHLAAIPSPGQYPDDVTFGQNVTSSFLVLDEAGRAGVGRIVVASSASALGFAWADRDLRPDHVPVTEDHEVVVVDAYGLSKVVTEEVAAYVTRRWGAATICLRFPFVGAGRRLADRVRELRADLAGARRDLWGWVHTLDAADAVLASLTSPVKGHHVVNIAAGETLSETPTAELVAAYLPDTEVRAQLAGHASLFDTSRGRRVLGFTARRGWGAPGPGNGRRAATEGDTG
ncbi:NAD-dependent epimerase/dehydratase family protein [Jiangella alkaliphila]|uniref:Nucleoside-diphosphate-sugar epimerase n=1 Tax=Jiangella alkaliphila TaxID=419479 RepID=A0A1H2LFM3_9ACTN|nr:NAD(P)-dependent oxidoreductase [Jiangella alkaliphila]SDU79709.1 Nucleoside-diphosphate-sugar epimerase [Jiangella alkaliphila]